jgi:FMN phosphatase YigB (HAD superfamily)
MPKYVFTNADRRHAERCLSLLGLADCFHGVICFEDVMAAAALKGLVHHGRPVVCKPNRQAMEIALQLAGGADSGATVFFDDSTRNVTAGAKAGVYSVLVGRTGVDCAADQQIRSMHDLPLAMPWLWGGAPDRSLELGHEEDMVTIGTTVYVQA